MRPLRLALLLSVAVLGTVGCSKLRDAALKQKTANDLKKLCDLYGAFYSARSLGPESGGMVLMVDGSVEEMKPAKFAASQKGNALANNGPG